LYGCETWSLTFRLRVFENRAVRKTFWPIREEIIGGMKKNIVRGAV
jgi:hypothetical protein